MLDYSQWRMAWQCIMVVMQRAANSILFLLLSSQLLLSSLSSTHTVHIAYWVFEVFNKHMIVMLFQDHILFSQLIFQCIDVKRLLLCFTPSCAFLLFDNVIVCARINTFPLENCSILEFLKRICIRSILLLFRYGLSQQACKSVHTPVHTWKVLSSFPLQAGERPE